MFRMSKLQASAINLRTIVFQVTS